jgi:hypothetical protein
LDVTDICFKKIIRVILKERKTSVIGSFEKKEEKKTMRVTALSTVLRGLRL